MRQSWWSLVAWIFLLFSAGVACLFADGKTSGGESYRKTTVQYGNIPGVDPALLSLDLYGFGDAAGTYPVVVWIHGGGWSAGDKANQLENKLGLFHSLGYMFISVNYRLSASGRKPGAPVVMFPDHNEDVADAIVWIIGNIGNYGGDRSRIAIMGHSAGGHLAALTGTSRKFLPERGIPLDTLRGIVCIDTEGYDVARMAGSGNQLYLRAFGKDPVAWMDASPIHAMDSAVRYPPFFIATRGDAERRAGADAFAARLESVGTVVRLVDGSGYTHSQINDAIGRTGEKTITAPLVDFLRTCFSEP